MGAISLDNITESAAYLLGDKVADICAPLFNNFPINYFCYAHKYHDSNNVMHIISHKKWLHHYVQSPHPFLYTKKPISSWSTIMPPKGREEAAELGLYNGILLEKEHSEYTEVLEFASPNENCSSLEFCYNRDLLNQFLLYFKDKTSDIVKIVEKEPLIIPENRILRQEVSHQTNDPYINFYKAINIKKRLFKFEAKKVFFSRREYEVLCLIADNKSMAEVAEILKISRRTVETYVYNAKSKTEISTVSKLLDEFANNLF